MSVGAAFAFFSSVSSGMMALAGIVFALAFVTVQFSAVAYSPRLVISFANNPRLFHTLGIVFATFVYSLVALAWTDRSGLGEVPLFSTLLVMFLLVVSMFAFARLIQNLSDLQIHNVLQSIGARGRIVIQTRFHLIPDIGPADGQGGIATMGDLGPVTQTLIYSGEPLVIESFDIDALVRLARSADAVVAIECGVGETLVEHTVLLRVHGVGERLPERLLMHGIHLGRARTFEQDPRYAIRLLVDIAIRALSPAVNDPTTAVRALDQIEDLLRRLGHRELDAGRVRDADGALRLIVPTPTWQDYLSLSFDEIRQFGATSVQVARRLRAVLAGLSDSAVGEDRRAAVRRYLNHLDLGVERSAFDQEDQVRALEEDRQGLGL